MEKVAAGGLAGFSWRQRGTEPYEADVRITNNRLLLQLVQQLVLLLRLIVHQTVQCVVCHAVDTCLLVDSLPGRL